MSDQQVKDNAIIIEFSDDNPTLFSVQPTGQINAAQMFAVSCYLRLIAEDMTKEQLTKQRIEIVRQQAEMQQVMKNIRST